MCQVLKLQTLAHSKWYCISYYYCSLKTCRDLCGCKHFGMFRLDQLNSNLKGIFFLYIFI